ncbi:MAG: EutN/CcmL family microcompartment protein [Planctomycetes bacterium]|nr:EutN/CcmL family microcompartment protein [Planctomycetota bacterium]
MNLARIVGHATSTVKHPSLAGWRLLVAQPLDAAGGPEGEPVLAIDELGAGLGDVAMISSDGGAIREMMRSKTSPVRWAVIGLMDSGAAGDQ